MEKLAREGQVIKYTEEARKVLKQERPNACTGFSLCDSVKRTIGPGNFITLCSDDVLDYYYRGPGANLLFYRNVTPASTQYGTTRFANVGKWFPKLRNAALVSGNRRSH